MNYKYSNIDYLIVGAGLYGATIARLLYERGYKCLIIDKRPHLAGNIYTEKTESGIDKHVYGPHIFHTNDEDIWEFVNCFAIWEPFQQNTLAYNNDRYFNLPFNAMTFYQIFGEVSPEKMYKKIEKEIEESGLKYKYPENLEEQAIKLVGKTIYNLLIKGYTTKQWGTDPKYLSPDIIKRLPLRFSFNNNYFNDKYQAIPLEGYTKFVENIIGNIPYILNTEFKYDDWAGKVKGMIYCGAVDEFLDYELGNLQWRSLKFVDDKYIYNGHNGQGCAVINYTGNFPEYTRVVDHMYFQPFNLKSMTGKEAIHTYEYPDEWLSGKEKYYAVNNKETEKLYKEYIKLLKTRMPEVQLGGRLGKYRYFDMDDTIAEAMKDAQNIFDKNDK